MSKNQKGFSGVESLLILIVVVVIAGVGWYVWSSKKKTDSSLNNTDARSLAESSPKKNTEATYKPVIPDGWRTYTNTDYGFSFAYPQEWGNLQVAKPALGADYDPYWLLYLQSGAIDQHEENGIAGRLSVSVVSQNFKEFRTVKAGTPLEYVTKNGAGYWVASTKVDVEGDDYKPGDKVPVPVEKQIKGTSIFRVEGNYECNQNAEWWFATTKGIVHIAMPRFSSIGGEITGVCSGSREISNSYWQKTYKQILSSINIQ